MGQHSRKLSSFIQTRAQNTWQGFNQGIRGKECIIALRHFLHQFLVFIQLLKRFDILARDVVSCSLINVLLVSKDTNTHLWSGNVLQFNSASKTLVLLWIIVLQSYL